MERHGQIDRERQTDIFRPSNMDKQTDIQTCTDFRDRQTGKTFRHRKTDR